MFKCESCGNVGHSPMRTVAGIRERTYKIYKNVNGRMKLIKVSKGHEITKELDLCSACSGARTPEVHVPYQYDCNLCTNRDCQGDFIFTKKYSDRNHVDVIGCWKMTFQPIKSSFPLVELAMEHPQSLQNTFNNLVLSDGNKVRLRDYIK